MKRILFLFVPVMVVLAGCNRSDDDDVIGESLITSSINEITLNSSEASRQQLSVTSNGSWTASVSPASAGSWISVSPSSGSTGTTTVIITIAENETQGARSAVVSFTMPDGTSDRIRIEQPQAAGLFLEVTEEEYEVGWEGENIEILVSYNIESYTIDIVPESAESWISQTDGTFSTGQDRLIFTIAPREIEAEREAFIVFSSPDGSLTETVRIFQSGRPVRGNYADGDYLQLQRATVGTGINIVIMGDGYTENEINAQEIYERDMRASMEDFFSVYPYDAYRNYFNVWMVVGVSNQSGPSIGNTMRDTKFGTWITGEGTSIEARNESVVTDYAKSIPGIPQDEGLLTVLLIINSPVYAGTCIMYGSGYSIAMCPRIESPSPNTNARAVVIHECGGHGFGQLADEYAYGGTIPASEQADIRQWQSLFGAFMNVDFTANPNQVLWSEFFNYPKYTTNFVGFPIGVYQGGLTYTSGVYRPEFNSCMNDNIDYYNAPSRYEIVRRIMALSGVDTNFTLTEFVAQDNPQAPTYSGTLSRGEVHKGFGRPILRP